MPLLLEVTDQAPPRNSHTQTTEGTVHGVTNVIYFLKINIPCGYQGQLHGCATCTHPHIEGPILSLILFYFSLEIPNNI